LVLADDEQRLPDLIVPLLEAIGPCGVGQDAIVAERLAAADLDVNRRLELLAAELLDAGHRSVDQPIEFLVGEVGRLVEPEFVVVADPVDTAEP